MRRGSLRGYLETGGGSALRGTAAPIVRLSVMPVGMLLVLRMAVSAVALGVLYGRPTLTAARDQRVAWPLVLMGFLSAGDFLLYFTAVRWTSVSVAVFLVALAPVYVAVATPIVFRQPPDRVVWLALVLALLGMASIVVPGIAGSDSPMFLPGMVCAIGSGILWATTTMVAKAVRGRVGGGGVVLVQSIFTALLLLPLGVWQVVSSGYRFALVDVGYAVFLALVATVLALTLFYDGLHYIRVDHGSIMTYFEPVSAPLFALLLLGEVPGAWTIAGGACITVGGVLVVALGKRDSGVEAGP